MQVVGLEALDAGQQEAGLIAEGEPDATVGGADRTRAHPDHVARRAEGVEVGRLVVGKAGPEDVTVERRRDQRGALQLGHHVDERIHTLAVRADAVPAGQEAGEGARIDRFHLLAERGERPPPELPQDVVVAPLALDAVGAELAPDDPALDLEPLQRGPHRLRRHPVAAGGVLREERTMGAGIAGDEVEHRVGHRLGAAPREADGHGDAERVAQAAGILGRAQAFLPGDRREEGAALGHELIGPVLHGRPVHGPQVQLVDRQRTEQS